MARSFVRCRRFALAAMAGLLYLASACENDPAAPDPEINFVGAWLGQPWRGTASPHLAADSLFVHGTAVGSNLYVRASVRFDGPGTYPLAHGAAEMYTLIGGDVVGERYVSVAADDAVLIVREHAGGVMTGRLAFTARKAPAAGAPAVEGRFDAEFEAEVRS